MNPLAMLVDTSRCIGCRACQVACKQWNGIEAEVTDFRGSYENPPTLTAHTWRRVKFIEIVHPDTRDLRWLFLTDSCKHCADAGCVSACPTGAIKRTEYGTVLVDKEVCNGCRYCIPACPYGVMSFDEEQGIAQKCTFCPDRVSNGRETACAEVCPTDAITFGSRDERMAAAERRVEELRARGVATARLYGKDEFGGLGVIHVLEDRPSVYGLPEEPPRPKATLFMDSVTAVGAVLAVMGIVLAGLGHGWNPWTSCLAGSGAALILFAVACAFAARGVLAAYAGGEPAMRAQSPHWEPWIPLYFFLGGVSGGAFFLAGLADVFPPPAPATPTAVVARYGYAVAFLLLLPCAPCLIVDLGRPRRFLNTLLSFKPGSPMSMGAWALILFSGLSTVAAFRAWGDILPLAGLVAWIPRSWVGLVGIFAGAFVAAYPGVCLGATYRPVWMQARVLGALFFVSGAFSGLAAILGALRCSAAMFPPVHEPLAWIALWAGVLEIFLLAALVLLMGPASRAVIGGRRSLPYYLGVIGFGLLLPLWIHRENLNGGRIWRELGPEQWLLVMGSLAGAGILRALIVNAGQDRGKEAAR